MGIGAFSGRLAGIPLELFVVDYAARTLSVRAALRWPTALTSCTASVMSALASARTVCDSPGEPGLTYAATW